MRKYLFLSFAALPFIATAQEKADRIVLKNGKTVLGHIYKIADGSIYLVKTADSAVYNAGEVNTIMFCSTGKDINPVPPQPPLPCGGGQGSGIKSVNSQTSTFSSIDENDAPVTAGKKTVTEKASVVFRCNMCGGDGTLSVAGENGKNSTTTRYTFTMEDDRHSFSHTMLLQPGVYNWQYHDSNNNATKGKFIVAKGEEKKIILFEQE
jgi:hypothetical protein